MTAKASFARTNCTWRVTVVVVCCILLKQCCVEALPSSANTLLDRMYCGQENCYDVLGVGENTTKAEIRKAYRRLSLLYHPDRNNTEDAAKRFRKIVKAHEVLTDDKNREAYDYFLRHPDSLLALYYGIRAVYPSQTSPLTVLVIVLVFGSIIQYVNQGWKRRWRVNVVQQTPQFKRAMTSKIEEQYGSRFKRLKPQEQQEVRNCIAKGLLDTVELDGDIVGADPPPWRLREVFAIQMLLLPWTIALWSIQALRWTVKYRLLKHEYTNEDKEELTRRYFGKTLSQWQRQSDEERHQLLELELWDSCKKLEYEAKLDEEERQRRANSARYRQWKRWKKEN